MIVLIFHLLDGARGLVPSAHRNMRLCFASPVIVAIQLAVLLRLLYTLSRELLDGSSLNLVIRSIL